MIRAVWEAPCALSITGHAGYAPAGQDIVCAGVSTLWGTLAEELQVREGEGQGVATVTGELLAFRPEKENEAEIERIFEMIWRGVLLLAGSYGRYIEARREW